MSDERENETARAASGGELPEALFARLGKRLPLLLDAPEKFLRYATWRARFDAFRRATKNALSVRRSRDGWRVALCGGVSFSRKEAADEISSLPVIQVPS